MRIEYCSEVKCGQYSTSQHNRYETRQRRRTSPLNPIGADDSTVPRLSQLLNWAADLMLSL